jgi:hypothetical protein
MLPEEGSMQLFNGAYAMELQDQAGSISRWLSELFSPKLFHRLPTFLCFGSNYIERALINGNGYPDA